MKNEKNILNGVKTVVKVEINNAELLNICRKTATEISEFHALFMAILSFLEGAIDDGIVPPESMRKGVDFLHGYGHGVKYLFELIDDYINTVECIEENSDFASRVVLLEKNIVSYLRERSCFRGSDFSALETITSCKNTVAYWCKQKWLGGEMAYDPTGSIHLLEGMYENLVRLLDHLTACFEAHISELERFLTVERERSLELVRLEENERTSSEQIYPYMHSNAVRNDENDLMMGDIYGSPLMIMDYQNKLVRMKDEDKERRNKAAFCMYCGSSLKNGGEVCTVCGKSSVPANAEDTRQFCMHCGTVNHLASRYCIYCGMEIRKRNAPDTPPITCALPNIMARKICDFFKRLYKRR